MAKSKWVATNYPGVFKYELKSGIKYGIRVRYQDDNFQWKEKSESGFTKIKDARSRRTELETIVNQDASNLLRNNNITFGDWCKQFSELKKHDWTDATKQNFNYHINSHLSVYKEVQLSKITLNNYQKLINRKLHDEEVALSTVTTMHKIVMSLFNLAVKHEVLSTNKLRGATIRKEEVQKDKSLDTDALLKFDEYATKNLKTMEYAMYTLLRVGWRKAEVSGLTSAAITIIDDKTLDVSVIKARTNLRKEGKAPKTKASYRTNQLKGNMARAILDAIELAKWLYQKYDLDWSDDSFVFINPRTGKLYSPEHPNNLIKRMEKELGIEATSRSFRHAFASQANAKGINPVEIARWLGHSKVDTTLNTYTHPTVLGRNTLTEFANFL